MIRRSFLVAAAAVALSLAPMTAMAYPAAKIACTVTDSTPASGVPFTASCSGVAPNSQVTLAITGHRKSMLGTKSQTNLSDASGRVSWVITLTEAGRYRLVATNAAGKVIGRQSVTVSGVIVAGVSANAPAGTGAGVSAGAAAATGVGTQLSSTGFAGMPLAVGGGALVLVGAGAVLIGRRRKSGRVPA